MPRSLWFSAALLVFCAPTASGQWTASRPDGLAPIGVTLDHTLNAGEYHFAYRYAFAQLNGLRAGTDDIKFGDAIDPNLFGFLATPTDLSAQSHALELTYAPTSRLTLVGTLPIKTLSMDHLDRRGRTFKTESSGISDIGAAALYMLEPVQNQRLHVIAAFSFPSGSIDEEDATLLSNNQDAQLPYAMQTGSGTLDATPGITYLGQIEDWSWGAQALATFRLGENDNKYRLGHRYTVSGWGARRINDWLSGSLRLEVLEWEAVKGADPKLDSSQFPTAVASLQAGSRWSAGFGVNTYIRNGTFRGLRLAGEWLAPFYQDLEGPQLETDWVLVFGAQYSRAAGSR